MPLYEYECDACGKRFEHIQKFSDPPLEICTQCGQGPVRRLLSAPAFQFKGSGWYITDYAKKSGTADAPAPTGDKADKAGKSDAGEKSEKSEKGDTAKTTEKSESKPSASETKPSTTTTPSKE